LLGLGASLARSGRTWRTIERLVGFGMAHWLPGHELCVRGAAERSPALTGSRVDPPGPRPAARHAPRPARPRPQ
jgi:hypothetical protein